MFIKIGGPTDGKIVGIVDPDKLSDEQKKSAEILLSEEDIKNSKKQLEDTSKLD